jgi:cytosine/adenosine deaminase-related metal-dependent hydrolase
MPARRLSAEWVYPVTAPPIPWGAVLVGEDGRIVAVGRDAEVPSPPGVPAEHFPGSVLMPGLVNAHTHLELTGFAGDVDESEFDAWIRSVRSLKERRSAEDFRVAAKEGVQQCFAAGVTTVAETGDSGAVVEALDELGGRGVVFQEVFGPHPDQCEVSLAALARRVAMLEASASARLRIGVSPHAPYTVSGSLYRAVAEFARNEGLAMAVHIAESQAESDLLATGTGPFHEAWQKRGIPLPEPPGDSPIAWLERHGILGPGLLCIHSIRIDEVDIDLLARRECAVAHCPVSSRSHGHGDAPLRALLDAGIPVGLGTDSEISASPMDLLNEARLAKELGGLSAVEALELATVGSAEAIGWGDTIGGVHTGRWADIVVRQFGGTVKADTVADRLLHSTEKDVVLTTVAGIDRYRRP